MLKLNASLKEQNVRFSLKENKVESFAKIYWIYWMFIDFLAYL